MIIVKFGNSLDPDEVAYDEPPHLDLHCFINLLTPNSQYDIAYTERFYLICRRKFCRLLFFLAILRLRFIFCLRRMENHLF